MLRPRHPGWSVARSGARVATSGARTGAQVVRSGVRSGAQAPPDQAAQQQAPPDQAPQAKRRDRKTLAEALPRIGASAFFLTVIGHFQLSRTDPAAARAVMRCSRRQC